jgi:hypothetical protein
VLAEGLAVGLAEGITFDHVAQFKKAVHRLGAHLPAVALALYHDEMQEPVECPAKEDLKGLRRAERDVF